jgi:hypothetical protein
VPACGGRGTALARNADAGRPILVAPRGEPTLEDERIARLPRYRRTQ